MFGVNMFGVNMFGVNTGKNCCVKGCAMGCCGIFMRKGVYPEKSICEAGII